MSSLLIILCVLSIIGASFGVFYGFGLAGIAAMPRADIESALAATGFGSEPQLVDQMLLLADMWPWFIAFNAIELVGVIMLLRKAYAGFHVYAASQVGLAGLMVISVGFSGALISILWNALWVMLYFNVLRKAPLDDGRGDNEPGGSAD